MCLLPSAARSLVLLCFLKLSGYLDRVAARRSNRLLMELQADSSSRGRRRSSRACACLGTGKAVRTSMPIRCCAISRTSNGIQPSSRESVMHTGAFLGISRQLLVQQSMHKTSPRQGSLHMESCPAARIIVVAFSEHTTPSCSPIWRTRLS
ncbi:hypothetical protein C2E23DRAFT_601797 [Lenzites betulinus]|nr:hypothetical protein C2E23DRAFT_601797 [Lenzites betulinus]